VLPHRIHIHTPRLSTLIHISVGSAYLKPSRTITMTSIVDEDRHEIKILLIGEKGAGKTTLWNTLTGAGYGPVQGKQHGTSRAYNLVLSPENLKAAVTEKDASGGLLSKYVYGGSSSDKRRKVCQPFSSSVAGVRGKIENLDKDAAARAADLECAEEESFKVEVPECILDMREDTRLCATDTGALGEDQHKNYVKKNYNGSELVIIVLDGKALLCNHVESLDFVKHMHENNKETPLVFVLNKVDDPNDKESAEYVKQVLELVKERFCDLATDTVAFVSTSIESAFVLRAAARMNKGRFLACGAEDHPVSLELLEKVFRPKVDTFTWDKLEPHEKYKLAHELISKRDRFSKAMEDTGYDDLLLVISSKIGGAKKQAAIVAGIITKRKLPKLQQQPPDIFAGGLRVLYDQCERITLSSVDFDAFSQHFWDCYKVLQGSSFDSWDSYATSKNLLSLMKYLECYYNAFKKGSKLPVGEAEKIVETSEALSNKFARKFLHAASGNCWSLSPKDYIHLCESFKLLPIELLHSELQLPKSLLRLMPRMSDQVSLQRDRLLRGDYNLIEASCSCGELLTQNWCCYSCSADTADLGGAAAGISVRPPGSGCPYGCQGGTFDNDKCSKCLEKSKVVETLKTRACFKCLSCGKQLGSNRVCIKCPAHHCQVAYVLTGGRKRVTCPNCQQQGGVNKKSKCSCGHQFSYKIIELPGHKTLELLDLGIDDTPVDAELYDSLVKVKIPEDIDDENHFWHLIWRHSQLKAKIETWKTEESKKKGDLKDDQGAE